MRCQQPRHRSFGKWLDAVRRGLVRLRRRPAPIVRCGRRPGQRQTHAVACGLRRQGECSCLAGHDALCRRVLLDGKRGAPSLPCSHWRGDRCTPRVGSSIGTHSEFKHRRWTARQRALDQWIHPVCRGHVFKDRRAKSARSRAVGHQDGACDRVESNGLRRRIRRASFGVLLACPARRHPFRSRMV